MTVNIPYIQQPFLYTYTIVSQILWNKLALQDKKKKDEEVDEDKAEDETEERTSVERKESEAKEKQDSTAVEKKEEDGKGLVSYDSQVTTFFCFLLWSNFMYLFIPTLKLVESRFSEHLKEYFSPPLSF